MPSASSCFLLSFCFRKVVLGSFSDSTEKFRELFPIWNIDGARRGPAGGPTTSRWHLAATPPLAAWVSHLEPSSTASRRLFAYKFTPNLKTEETRTYFPKDVWGRCHLKPWLGRVLQLFPAPYRRGESTPEEYTPPCLPPEWCVSSTPRDYGSIAVARWLCLVLVLHCLDLVSCLSWSRSYYL